jgi:CheY-like chemotaxis protein
MAGKPTILCVDDRIDNARIRVMLLEQFGCAGLAVTDGTSALRVLKEQPIDLIIIDYHLVGETGEDVARDVRVLWPKLPLIMLTGDSKLPESARASVDEVLIKGSNPGMLLDAIRRLLPESEMKARRPMLVEKKVQSTTSEEGATDDVRKAN